MEFPGAGAKLAFPLVLSQPKAKSAHHQYGEAQTGTIGTSRLKDVERCCHLRKNFRGECISRPKSPSFKAESSPGVFAGSLCPMAAPMQGGTSWAAVPCAPQTPGWRPVHVFSCTWPVHIFSLLQVSRLCTSYYQSIFSIFFLFVSCCSCFSCIINIAQSAI